MRALLRNAAALLVVGLPFAATSQQPMLELTAGELARLGVEWARPDSQAAQAVVSAPAVAVVPPAQETVVSAPVGGLVTRLLVAEGSEVDEGDALIELRSLELLAAQREYIDAASAARLSAAQLERDRMLHTEGIIARRRLDEAEADALAAELRAEQARQHLRLVGADDAALERLGASGEISADLTLRAPSAGVVIARHGAVGEQVDALEPIVRLADLTELWLEARVRQEQADRIAAGMRLEVVVRGERMGGDVFQVGRTVDPVTQTVLVRARVANPELRLRADQVLSARILTGVGGPGTLAVPMSAVARIDGYVYLFTRSGSGVRPVPVSIVAEDGALAHVESGELDADSEIAVRGVSALKAMLTAGEE